MDKKSGAGSSRDPAPDIDVEQTWQSLNKESPSQLSTSAVSIAGLQLVLPDICGGCGTHELAVIAANAELHCTNCATSRGHIGPKTRAFLLAILTHFGHLGRPTEIVMRRPVGEIESTDLILQQPAHAGRLMSGMLARRRQQFRNSGGGA